MYAVSDGGYSDDDGWSVLDDELEQTGLGLTGWSEPDPGECPARGEGNDDKGVRQGRDAGYGEALAWRADDPAADGEARGRDRTGGIYMVYDSGAGAAAAVGADGDKKSNTRAIDTTEDAPREAEPREHRRRRARR